LNGVFEESSGFADQGGNAHINENLNSHQHAISWVLYDHKWPVVAKHHAFGNLLNIKFHEGFIRWHIYDLP
jgi:hypothetical protein